MRKRSLKLTGKETGGLTIITGLIAPYDWDQNNNPIEVRIATSGEKEYVVENNALGQELLKCLHKQVRVVGITRKDKKGNDIIAVQEYEIIR